MKSVKDIVGPWRESDFNSNLIDRCRKSWSIPIDQLSNEMLATFFRQKIAVQAVLTEAKKRLTENVDDGSELYEGELAVAAEAAGLPD